MRIVTLDPARGRRDAAREHRPKLLEATMKVEIDHVLSEGEASMVGRSCRWIGSCQPSVEPG